MEYTVEKYKEAVEAWRKAVEELDQAHAVLRDIGLHKAVDTAGGAYRMTPDSVTGLAFSLLEKLENYTCDECGRGIADHDGVDCQEWK